MASCSKDCCDKPTLSKKPRFSSKNDNIKTPGSISSNRNSDGASPNRNSSGSRIDESINNVKENLPTDISEWTEQHIQNLSIATEYSENLPTEDLINMFHADDEHLKEAMREFIVYL